MTVIIKPSGVAGDMIGMLVCMVVDVKRGILDEPAMKQERVDALGNGTGPKLGVFLNRAMHLRCPECGITRVFKPLRQTRTLSDWFTPLAGCPQCNFSYEREQGYFLMAIWGVQYFVVAGFGLGLGLVLMTVLKDMRLILAITVIPTVILGFIFIRHAKSFYLAIDHFLDPQAKPDPLNPEQ
jgi:uncharacterized protein (DUF983 family)